MPANNNRFNDGFTLIELVIGIMVFAIALSLFMTLIVPQARQSVEPILQVRATELAQSLMSEIVSKSFDENSSRNGELTLCNENTCTPSSKLRPENGESRATYNDVDDYNGLGLAPGENINNALGQAITLDGQLLYEGFTLRVTVYYDDDMNGIDDAIDTGAIYTGNTKFIRIIVTTPSGEHINFSSYRSNY